MGCLNSKGQFSHWFGNIHLSGPCNRACYFCIGQHMMSLDSLNNLDQWPMPGIDEFITLCNVHGITEVNITGSNTDPLLYKHMHSLYSYLKNNIPNFTFGVRTNGVLVTKRPDVWNLFDKGSLSFTTFNPNLYIRTMGIGSPPNLKQIMSMSNHMKLKMNVVLTPETVNSNDIFETIRIAGEHGIEKVNVREPYGQSHIGNPFSDKHFNGTRLGMPKYKYFGVDVTYWDVHYVEVESVNLYANGVVNETYPVTKGHNPERGSVRDQSYFKVGRHAEQWLKWRKKCG